MASTDNIAQKMMQLQNTLSQILLSSTLDVSKRIQVPLGVQVLNFDAMKAVDVVLYFMQISFLQTGFEITTRLFRDVIRKMPIMIFSVDRNDSINLFVPTMMKNTIEASRASTSDVQVRDVIESMMLLMSANPSKFDVLIKKLMPADNQVVGFSVNKSNIAGSGSTGSFNTPLRNSQARVMGGDTGDGSDDTRVDKLYIEGKKWVEKKNEHDEMKVEDNVIPVFYMSGFNPIKDRYRAIQERNILVNRDNVRSPFKLNMDYKVKLEDITMSKHLFQLADVWRNDAPETPYRPKVDLNIEWNTSPSPNEKAKTAYKNLKNANAHNASLFERFYYARQIAFGSSRDANRKMCYFSLLQTAKYLVKDEIGATSKMEIPLLMDDIDGNTPFNLQERLYVSQKQEPHTMLNAKSDDLNYSYSSCCYAMMCVLYFDTILYGSDVGFVNITDNNGTEKSMYQTSNFIFNHVLLYLFMDNSLLPPSIHLLRFWIKCFHLSGKNLWELLDALERKHETIANKWDFHENPRKYIKHVIDTLKDKNEIKTWDHLGRSITFMPPQTTATSR